MESLRKDLAPIRMRNYGRILQDIVAYACTIEDVKERQIMTVYIAQCMRQKNMVWNRDQEFGLARVKADVATLSNGQLTCDFPEFEQMLSQMPGQGNPQMSGKKKKK